MDSAVGIAWQARTAQQAEVARKAPSAAGRFAPSPTSDLHLGNLRTALAAWLMARSTGRRFIVRMEDLDSARVRAAPQVAARQLRDLDALGLDWDGPVVRQSDRLDQYADALRQLPSYECFCTRREIVESASAPHGDGYRPYPGTCRSLADADRAAMRALRPPALRVRAASEDGPRPVVSVTDLWQGEVTGEVDDFVVRRFDGAFAYNLAVVVDDLAQGVDQVVRGDDLLSSSSRQAWLIGRLGGIVPQYAHVPLVVNSEGRRLAKRDGAVTLADLAAQGTDAEGVRSLLGNSLSLNEPGEPVTASELLARFDPAALPRTPWAYAAAPPT